MKILPILRSVLLLLFVLLYSKTQGQVTVWNEDFSTYSNGTLSGTGSGASPANWNSQVGASVNGGLILARNTRAVGSSTLANPLVWATNPIDISSFTNVGFSINSGAFDTNQFENSGGSQDNFTLQYRINGGAWIQVFNLSGSTTQPINPSYSVSGLLGSTLEIRARFHNTAGNENYTIDNVLVTGFSTTPNQPPVLTTTGDQEYCPGLSMPVVATISITDPDDTTAFALAIQISSGYIPGEDLLTLTGLHPSITSTWSAVEGKLTLTGPALLSEFEAAVSAVEYSSSAPSPSGTRGFSITVGDANYLPPTGHYYEFVSSTGITWTAARTAAAARTYYGLQGYLATLTSQEEADFSGSQALGVGWIGGSDAATEGQWLWVTGPEAGLNFWNGNAGGSSPNFAFWNTNEPNQSGNEDYAHITHPNVNPNGSWNDLSNTGAASGNYQPQGYVVEYGGMPGDPILFVTGTTIIRMDDQAPTASSPTPVTVYCTADIPTPDISVVTDEADNCTLNPAISYISDVSNGGNPEVITRTYRVADASGNTVDVTQTITVTPIVITTQPINQTVLANTNAVFAITADNADSYQWEVSIDGGSTWSALSDGPEYSGAVTATLTVLGTEIDKDSFLYRARVSNSSVITCPDVLSSAVLLTVRLSTIITNRRITYRVNQN